MFFDETGNIRPGCKVIAKGEVYDRQKFSGKDSQFKTVAFRKEAQELFKDINNSLITDEKVSKEKKERKVKRQKRTERE